MAGVRQYYEAVSSIRLACMAEAGIPVKVSPDGGMDAEFPEVSDDTEREQLYSALSARMHECDAQVREQLGPEPEVHGDEAYDRLLDTVACLQDQKVDGLGEPPSREKWLQGFAVGDFWMPYEEIRKSNPDMLEREWNSLKSACPESGYSYSPFFEE